MPELRRLLFSRPNIPSFREMLCPLPLSQMERASLERLPQPPGMSGSINLLARGCQGFRPQQATEPKRQQAARSPQNLVQAQWALKNIMLVMHNVWQLQQLMNTTVLSRA